MSERAGGLCVADLDFEGLIGHEWLAVNGIGGYACSTVPSLNTRRYHGLLVAAMAPPVRRMVLLSRVEETILAADRESSLASNEYPGTIWPRGHEHLRAFSAEPFPRWAYQGTGWTVEKQLRLLHGENTVVISYILLGGGNKGVEKGIELELRPIFALRGIHDLNYQWNGKLVAEQRWNGHYHLPATSRTPEVFFASEGAFTKKPNWYLNTIYRRESERGYPGLEDVWSPGVIRFRLAPGQPVHFACSSEPFELERVVGRARQQQQSAAPLKVAPPDQADASPGNGNGNGGDDTGASDRHLDALLHAASTFVLSTRPGEVQPAVPSYPWYSPSPHAALAAFAGLFLVPARYDEAKQVLLSLVPLLRDGLLPSEFPEDGSPPVYGMADTSLWFINAVHQYLAYTADQETVGQQLLDPVLGIVEHFRRGTALGVHADLEGLLLTGQPGMPTTWMNAQAGEWVVTPRRGRAVEVNALWYNAICVAAALAQRFGRPAFATAYTSLARTIHESFNGRFWHEGAGYCYDVLENIPGDEGRTPPDGSVRPNQLLAVSLPFPVLAAERHAAVLDRVRDELLTPFGPRTLSPKDPNYQGHYRGNAAARDRAMHNGSVHPWLLGPYVTGLLRVRGRGDDARAEARRLLEPCLTFLTRDGLGQLPELFDGDAPHAPGGAMASAIAVGELFRCYAEDVLGRAPQPPRANAGEPQARPVGAQHQ